MKTQTMTAGKTATESVGVTETQEREERREAFETKKEDATYLIEQMHEHVGQMAELYRQLEYLGYSDHYLKQELEESYMGSIPEKLNSLQEEIDESEFDDEDEE